MKMPLDVGPLTIWPSYAVTVVPYRVVVASEEEDALMIVNGAHR